MVLNPRHRGKHKFNQIVTNIARLGLKKPITVALSDDQSGQPAYTLICGQGRLEAYLQLGEERIPAIVVRGTKEDFLLMSLAENVARRNHSTVELVQQIRILKDKGYTHAEIAAKTDLDTGYVRGILQLLLRGEERLLKGVENGEIPVSIAITIATADDRAVQQALAEAYEKNTLRGNALVRARRLIENRRIRGKSSHGKGTRLPQSEISADELLKTYQKETVRQKLVVQRAKICETRLLFTLSALRQLLKDDHFVTLLRAEGLDSLPESILASADDKELLR